jgi:hypothetical protein
MITPTPKKSHSPAKVRKERYPNPNTYVWPSQPLKQGFRPLRNPRSTFLDAA